MVVPVDGVNAWVCSLVQHVRIQPLILLSKPKICQCQVSHLSCCSRLHDSCVILDKFVCFDATFKYFASFCSMVESIDINVFIFTSLARAEYNICASLKSCTCESSCCCMCLAVSRYIAHLWHLYVWCQFVCVGVLLLVSIGEGALLFWLFGQLLVFHVVVQDSQM